MSSRNYSNCKVIAKPYKAAGGGWIPVATIITNSDDIIKIEGDDIYDDYQKAVEEAFSIAESNIE